MRNLKRLTTFILALSLSLALFLTGCGKNEKNEEYVFRIGTANSSLCLAPLHVAEDNGYAVWI